MSRRRPTLVAAWAIAVAGWTFLGPITPRVVAHSQLVTSVPAAGEVAAEPPTELRLIFSEPIEPGRTGLDLIGPDGSPIVTAIGAPDPGDRFSLVAPIDPLPDGIYTVEWRALSAADGHTTSGFLAFGVGDVPPPSQASSSHTGGSVHAGHDLTTAVFETASRLLGALGFLLAAGLPVIAWLVLRDPRSAGTARAIAVGLGLGALGAAGLLVLGGTGPGADLGGYATGTRTGVLLLTRILIGVLDAVVVLAIARTRSPVALVVGGVAGLSGLVLIAAGGHASAFSSPAPMAAMGVHLAAIGVWVAGILVLTWAATLGRRPERPMADLVPRFSALALVSVALIAITGVYADWVQTRAFVSLETPYGTTLAVKSSLAVAALALGALNYRSRGRDGETRFRPRVAVESALAVAVLAATGVLASGSPPAQDRPVSLAPAPSSALVAGPTAILELMPGRPGPTHFLVTTSEPADHLLVELQLQRLDTAGESRLELRPAGEAIRFAGDGLLPAGSRWDASVVISTHEEMEVSRTRFNFALDTEGVSDGRATPALDPAAILAAALLVGAVLGVAFTLGGGSLPRVDRSTGRTAVLSGSVVSAAVGALILVAGPRL